MSTILPKFKRFLSEKLIISLWGKENLGSLGYFLEDTSFVHAPYSYDNIKNSEDHDRKDLIKKHFEHNKNVYDMNSEVTKEYLFDLDFSLQASFSTVTFNEGISLKKLNEISHNFYEAEIFVSGDGHDYQLSEVTSDHSSEIILNIVINNKEAIFNEYMSWYKDWYAKNELKGASVKPKHS